MNIQRVSVILFMQWYSCMGQNDEKTYNPSTLFSNAWNVYSQQRFIRTNGRLSSIHEIFGGARLDHDNFNLDMILLGYGPRGYIFEINRDPLHQNLDISSDYIERYFSSVNTVQRGLSDTSTFIAKYIGRADRNLRIIFVEGRMKMGKTMALKKIQEVLNMQHPVIWTIMVDVHEIFENVPLNDITEEAIFSKFIGEQLRPVFNTLRDINPKRIVLLFDHIDYLIRTSRTKIISIIQSLSERGITVVITGREVLLRQMVDIPIDRHIMSNLGILDMEQYLMNQWKRNPRITTAHKERLEEYVVALTQVLHQTYLPKTFVALKMIAEEFSTRQSRLIGGSDQLFHVGCFDYVIDRSPLPADLLTVLQHVPNNPYDFYTGYLNRFSPRGFESNVHPSMKDIFVHYSKLALFRTIPELYDSPEFDIQSTVRILTEFAEAMDIIIPFHLDRTGFIFADPEIRAYFAARGIIENFESNIPSNHIFESQLFLNQDNRILVDFLNSAAERLSISRLTFIVNPNHQLNKKIMDSFLENGYSNLFRAIANKLLDDPVDNRNFQKYIKSYPLVEGLTSEARTSSMLWIGMYDPASLIRRQTEKYFASRLELIIEQNMATGSTWFNGITYHINDPLLGQRILCSIVKRPLFNHETFTMALNMISLDYVKPNVLLYHAVNELGDRCYECVEALHVKRHNFLYYPWDPAKVDVDGRTLVHAAARWNSVRLFNYLRDKLGVPLKDSIDNAGASVFSTVIDSNPAPQDPPPGWWTKMEYVVRNVENLQLPLVHHDISHNIDCSSPLSRSIFEGQPVVHHDDLLEMIQIYLNLDTAKTRKERIEIFRRIRSTAQWNLSRETLAYRRVKLLEMIHDKNPRTTQAELLIYYGANLMRQEDRHCYRRTIIKCLENERDVVTLYDKHAILRHLVHAARTVEDLRGLRNIMQDMNGLEQKEMVSALDVNINNILEKATDPTSSLQARLIDEFIREATRLRKDFDGVFYDNRRNRPSLPENKQTAVKSEELSESSDEENVRAKKSKKQNHENANQAGPSHQRISPRSETDETHTSTACLRRKRRSIFQKKCYIDWSDIDRFNDFTETRDVDKILINTDEFLETLAIEESRNQMKAQQLMEFARVIKIEHYERDVMTGKYKMLVNEILQHDGLTHYRKIQRIKDITDFFLERSQTKRPLGFRIPSKIIAIQAAAAVPFIRGIYGTIMACREETNGTDAHCFIGSVAIAISGLAIALPAVVPRLLPWSIIQLRNQVNAVLPFIRNHANILADIGLKWTSPAKLQKISNVLMILSLGFDIYNIVDLSRKIDVCFQQGTECSSKDKVDYIISLTFSCVSIPVTIELIMSTSLVTGVVVGFALMILEFIAMGINAIIYYRNKYHTTFGENVGIFFHSIVWLPPPASVQALVQRQEWIDQLQKNAIHLFESNDNIVAYAVGIGKFSDDKLLPATGFINMRVDNPSYSWNISRVIPNGPESTTLLCLPRVNRSASWEYDSRYVSSAVYQCQNTFVIADKQRWSNGTSELSYIIYDLEYIEEGIIEGSPTKNNLFLMSHSTFKLTVIGGIGNITNNFVIQNASFRGNILLTGESPSNILDLSSVNSLNLIFTWTNRLRVGRVHFDGDETFHLTTVNKSPFNLHIIGRADNADNITCDYRSVRHQFDKNDRLITTDSGGGQSHSNMDYVTDCSVSVVRPFTRIIGSASKNTVYTAQVWLNDAILTSTNDTVFAMIEPKESTFILLFLYQPLFKNLQNVTYSPYTKTLVWNLRQIESTFSLLVVPYHTGNIQQKTTINKAIIEPVNCVFIDNYFDATISIRIKESTVETNNMTIRNFNVFTSVSSSRLMDILERYQVMTSSISADLHVVMKITNSKTNETFTFGSQESERLYIDNNTALLFGGNGADVYVINGRAKNYSWINNEAYDGVLDTLAMPDVCDSIHAKSGSVMFDFPRYSMLDVTLYCSINNTANIHLVLLNYLMDSHHKHLQIYWQDALYMLLPPNWIHDDWHHVNSVNIPIALLITFDVGNEMTITLTSRDTYVVLNISHTNTYPLVAYKSGSNDVIITREYFDDTVPLLVVLLEEFYSTQSDSIAPDWLDANIFVVDDTMMWSDIRPRKLTAGDIHALLIDTMADSREHNNDNSNLFNEYHVNFTDIDVNRTTIIEHNGDSSILSNYKLGILIVTGAEPKEFSAKWIDNNGTSLAMCTRETCVIVRNWCESLHKLHRIEFVFSLSHRPIVITNIDQIECDQQDFDNGRPRLVKKLNKEFEYAQLMIQLTHDDDHSRLMRCVGSVFSEIVTKNSSFVLFGFTSLLQQQHFMNNNCKALFTFENLNKLSVEEIYQNVSNATYAYSQSAIDTIDNKADAQLVVNALSQFDSHCWRNFTNSLVKFYKVTYVSIDYEYSKIMDEVSSVVSLCLKK